MWSHRSLFIQNWWTSYLELLPPASLPIHDKTCIRKWWKYSLGPPSSPGTYSLFSYSSKLIKFPARASLLCQHLSSSSTYSYSILVQFVWKPSWSPPNSDSKLKTTLSGACILGQSKFLNHFLFKISETPLWSPAPGTYSLFNSSSKLIEMN